MNSNIFVSIFLIIAVLQPCHSWGFYGHMLTAYIAQQQLQQNNPDVWNTVNSYCSDLNNITDSTSQTFVYAAAWPDDLKYDAFTFLDDWHFFNLIYNPSNYEPQNWQNASIYDPSSPYAVYYCQKVITNSNSYQQPQDTFARSFMTRYLIHIVGDMHQPFHNIEYVSSLYPYSDEGGNKWNITMGSGTTDNSHDEYQELHSFWDWGAFMWPESTRPFSSSDWDTFTQTANNYTTTYPRSYFTQRLQNSNPNNWGPEAYGIAVQYGYNPLLNSSNPNLITAAYQQQAFEICQQQIALGGYRLADLIVSYYSQLKSQSF